MTFKKYVEERKKYNKAVTNNQYYHSDFRVGDIIYAMFIAICPVINIVTAVFRAIPMICERNQMKRLILIIGTVVGLCGCADNSNNKSKVITSWYVLPEGLKDCQIYRLEGGPIITVVRCPNSETSTTTHTKYPTTTILTEH